MGEGGLASFADFDLAQLCRYLDAKLDGAHGTLNIERTVGGMSNPTYFLSRGERHMVLRKQPPATLMPSAHAIDREFRVLRALSGSAVPVPVPIHYCADRNVVGTPFYLMERLRGRVFPEYSLPGVEPAERTAMYDSMCRTMAAIHGIDWTQVGLSDYGKPGNYFARQLSRWSKQWEQFRGGDNDNPLLDRMVAWLSIRVPDSDTLTLCHGDFRVGNVMFHASEPRVIGILDWELSTLGHPLVDVAFNTQAWRMAPDENGGLLTLDLPELGIPLECDYLESYYRYSASGERMTPFHQVFAMFRAAVGSAGVAARGHRGNAFLPDAAKLGHKLSRAYAQRGIQLIEGT